MTIVDVHVHALPDEQVAALEEHAGAPVAEGGALEIDGARVPLPPAMRDPAALVAQLDARGIDVGVLSAVPPTLGYTWPVDAAVTLADAANRGLAAFAAATGGRCGWLAVAPLQDAEAGAEVLARAREAGAAGALIGSNVVGANLDDPALRPFFAAAARLRMPLLVHAVDVLAESERMSRHYFSNLVGYPYEAGLAVGSIIASGMLDELPDLDVMFCHGGGTAPGLAGRWDRGWDAAGGKLGATPLPQPPSTYFRRLWFDTLVYSEPMLRVLADLAGPDRLMLGSDVPFPIADPDPVARLDWLPPEDRERVLGGTAAALLPGLPG